MHFVCMLKSIGFPVSMRGYEVQNMVASTTIGRQIDLQRMAESHVLNCNYEPQQFPGLIFRVRETKQVCLVFRSGQIVITGAKRNSHIVRAYRTMLSIVMQFAYEGPVKTLRSMDIDLDSDFEYSSDDELALKKKWAV